jgi:hypothetical protein
LGWLNSERHAFRFVWGTWTVLLLAALALVCVFATNVPFGEDWALAPFLAKRQSITLQFLWSLDNEHRIPLPWLIVITLARLSRGQFWLENLVCVLLLGGLAAGFIRVARQVRGRTSHADAFFPLVLLQLGQGEIFVYRMMINHVLSTALIGGLLALIVTQREGLTLGKGLLAGALVLCLPLCGANGLPTVLATAGWLGYAALRAWQTQTPGGKRIAWLSLSVAAGGLLLVVLYLIGYQSPPHHPRPLSLTAVLQTGSQALAVNILPWKPGQWIGVQLLIPGLLLLTVALLVRTAIRLAPERWRALGLLLFLGAMTVVVLAIGWGRSGLGPGAGSASRYAVVTVPVLLGIYLAWVLYGPAFASGFIPTGLMVLLLLTSSQQYQSGRGTASLCFKQNRSFLQELRAGAPAAFLALRYAGGYCPPALVEHIRRQLPLLHEARVGLFRNLADQPSWHEVPLDLTAAQVQTSTGLETSAADLGKDSSLVFPLPRPTFVYGLRIKVLLTNPNGQPGRFQVIWRKPASDTAAPKEGPAIFPIMTQNTEQTVLVWVNGPIDQVRLSQDVQTCHFDIQEMTLLECQEQ